MTTMHFDAQTGTRTDEAMADDAIRYSRGRNKFDANPEQRVAADFDAFEQAFLADRSTTKGRTFVCAAFRINGDSRPHRGKEEALPRAFLPFDLDSIPDADTFNELRQWFTGYRGFGYTTASHRPDAPRCRIVLAADRAMTREEGKRACLAMQRRVERDFGTGVLKFDENVYRAEQPLYTPLHGAMDFRFLGDPVNVDELLAEVPPEAESPTGKRNETGAHADWLAALLEGDDVHGNACKLVGRWVALGWDDATIRATMDALAIGVAAARGRERADELLGEELDRMLGGARRNGYDRPSNGAAGAQNASDGAVNGAVRKSAPQADSEPSGWPEPKPIVADLPPAPTFDANALLPPLLADYVLDEADRMPCPPDYIAAAMMVAIGSVLGSRCALKPKRRDDWIVTPNLFGGCVGDPATKKTPSIEKALRFLDRLEADEADRLAHRTSEYEAELAAHKAREAAIEKIMKQAAGDKKKPENADAMDAAIRDLKSLQPPEEPHARRFRTNDATIEKIGDILSKSPDGILVFRDELVGLLSSWEREGREADRAFYLEGWNGLGSFAIDRIGRGSLLVRTLNLSVFGGIQPDLLGRYLANMVESSDNDGRIQRFQVLVYPEAIPWEWRDRHPVHGAREKVRDTFLRLAAFNPVQDGATPADDFVKVPHFAFDDAAQEVFIEWSADLHHNVVSNEESALLRQHFAKYEKLFCALALILHVAEGRIGPIHADTALRAAAWTQYLAGHARRTYGLLEAQTVSAAQTLASRIAAGKLADGFTARDVHRKGWAALGTVHQVEAALGLLEEFGHVVGHERDDAPGRPTTRYAINPKARTRGPR